MAPQKPTIDSVVADRESTSDSLNYVEAEVGAHATVPLSEPTCDTLLGMVENAKIELLDIQKKIRHLQVADMDPHILAFQELMKKSNRLHNSLHGIKILFPTPTPSSASTGSSSSGRMGHVDVRLPKIDIPSFDGNLLDWVSFRDMFLSNVGNSAHLSDSNKLSYLKSLLTGEAARLTKSITLSNANYHIAWASLNDRYNNNRELLSAILNRFINQSSLQQSSSSALRSLVDTTQECIRSLNILGLPLDPASDAILLHLLNCKLDPTSKELWEQSLKDTSIPKLEDFFKFVEQRARAIAAGATSRPRPQRNLDDVRKPVRAHHAQSSPSCKVCNAHHPIYKCEKFLNLSVSDRSDTVKKTGLCFNCLQPGHSTRNCTSNGRCRECKEKHHSFLHRSREPDQNRGGSTAHQVPTTSSAPPERSKVDGNHVGSLHTTDGTQITQTMLATAVIQVLDNEGSPHLLRALLDSGSSASFITESCTNQLGLHRNKSDVEITGLASTSVSRSNATTGFVFRPHFKSNERYQLHALVLPRITGRLPFRRCDPKAWPHLSGLQLADPHYHVPANIDILLGADVFFNLLMDGRRTAQENQPIGIRSTLGWLIAGNLSSSPSTVRAHHANVDSQLDQLLQRFWEIESLEEVRKLTPMEQSCEEHFSRTHSRDKTGRFTVSFPWKEPKPRLGSSRELASRRFLQLERRLERYPEYKTQYIKFMREYEALGHMSIVKSDMSSGGDQDNNHLPNFIPHHFVMKEDSTTTKFRVVFDASAKTSTGFSLNDMMMVGPVTQDPLVDIIMRFRLHQIAFTADIAKMYRQIWINPEDREYQHILWRESPDEPIREYRLDTVTYGTAAAPYLATKSLQQLTSDEEFRFPIAANLIRRDMYVDDLMSGVDTIEQAITAKDQLIGIMESAKFELRKWSSNCRELIETLPEDLQGAQTLMPIEDDQSVKALGIYWNTLKDVFEFRSSLFSEFNNRPTKRSILSEMSRLFDPIGWLSPVLIRAKMLMQGLWQSQCSWDDPIDEHLSEQWKGFKLDLTHLSKIKIPRCVILNGTIQFELAGFSDASEKAYGAVVYLVGLNDRVPTKVSLITSKTRVAPLKQHTIPRLELCGAVLLAQLMINVKKALRVDIQQIRCWTDSTIVLGWIRSDPTTLKTYVSNRVVDIISHVPSHSWFHIAGSSNPADCCSRGLSVEELSDFSLWWNGPDFLMQRDEFPSSPETTEEDLKQIKSEERRQAFTATTVVKTSTLPILEKCSSLRKLLRITSWVKRFIHNYLNRKTPIKGPLTPSELNDARMCWIRRIQHQEFRVEIQLISSGHELPTNNRLLPLKPFLDPSKILRVGGRLRHSNLPDEQKHPILLPTHSRLTKLIINNQHIEELHGGPQLVLATLQQQYWIIRGRDSVRHELKKCVTCRRHAATTMQQQMGDLPSHRVSPGRPFAKCGIDYAGPFLLRPIVTRSKVTYKAYLCIIVCFVTRAVHLEVVSSLSTDAFIAALRRFVSRRGKPTDIFSDCGTNFIGADRQMKEMLQLIKSDPHNTQIADSLSRDGILWHFIPPGAPHFGGLWEAGVKSVKYHLHRVVGPNRLTYEEMTTVMNQIEACLNSRPLTQLSSNPEDLAALTPGHFLTGAPLNALPDPDLSTIAIGRLDRWQLLQHLQQQFWKRWSNEFLSRMQQRPKWLKQREQLRLNDLVLIKDERLPPMNWKLGRVIILHPGLDNLPRVATIKTADGEIKRPITKICLLPINSDE